MELTADLSSLSQAPPETLETMVVAAEDALSVRADPVMVKAAVATVMAGYRSLDFVDAAAFSRMATEALEEYPAVTLMRMASPRTGIVRQSKWPPAIAEMIAWCEGDIAPAKRAVELACLQIERIRSAKVRAENALAAAAARARADAEWEAGAPERAERAAAATRVAEEASRKARMDDAARRRITAAHGALTQRLCQWAQDKGPETVERVMSLDQSEMEAGVEREMREQGAGLAWLIERLGATA